MVEPGKLIPDYYITCGGCGYGRHVGETKLAASIDAAQEQGWVPTRARGWVCPTCAPVYAPKQEAADGHPR